jgi:hypothetical protein
MSRAHLERYWSCYWRAVLSAFEAFARREYSVGQLP